MPTSNSDTPRPSRSSLKDDDGRQWRALLAMRRLLAQRSRIAGLEERIAASAGTVRRPLKLPQPRSAWEIALHQIDELVVRDGTMSIAGWALLPEWDPANTSAFFCIDGNCLWVSPLPAVRRTDLAATLAFCSAVKSSPAERHLDRAGFRALIDISATGWPRNGGIAWLCLLHGDETASLQLPAPKLEGVPP